MRHDLVMHPEHGPVVIVIDTDGRAYAFSRRGAIPVRVALDDCAPIPRQPTSAPDYNVPGMADAMKLAVDLDEWRADPPRSGLDATVRLGGGRLGRRR